MTEQTTNQEIGEPLSWIRITGISFALASHVALGLTLLVPVTTADEVEEPEETVLVSFIEPPPPPPPEPPKEIKKIIETPQTPAPVPPPPEEPPVVFEDPSPIDVQAPPPAPPAPPSIPPDFEASEDITGRRMNPPRYPPQEMRRGIGGTVVLLVTIDAQGNVLDISVERSSRNRNLDRAAIDAARKWRFNPGRRNGAPTGGVVRVPIDFVPPN